MMPLKSIALMLVVQLTDAFIIFDILYDILSLSVIYLFHFPQMLHVHLVPHFLVDNFAACRVYH